MNQLIKLTLLIFILLFTLNAQPKLTTHIIPLFGNTSLGYYYTNIYVGNPPQQQSVIVDTGSGQLALPCSKCIQCGNRHIHRPFDLGQSSSSKFVTCQNKNVQLCKTSCGGRRDSDPCTFSVSYAEGSSLSGIIIEDDIKFQKDSEGEAIKTSFGCTTRETNLFVTQAANGIFGLAPHRNARLLDMLYERHSKTTGEDFLFSMCIAKNGGQINIGHSKDQLHFHNNSIKTTFTDSRNLYSLENVGQITANQSIIRGSDDLGYFGLFIDSGSTFTYFPRGPYQKLIAALQNSCAYHSERCLISTGFASQKCFKIDPFQNKTISLTVGIIFPSIDIQINGKVVSWSPRRFLLLRRLGGKEVCLGVQALDRYLLGANWMMDRDIVFNLKQKTVQIFPEAYCSLTEEMDVQLPGYIGGEQGNSLSYIAAVFHQNSQMATNILIFIIILVILIGILMIVGTVYKVKNQSKTLKKKQEMVPEEEHDNIKIRNNMASESILETQQNLPKQVNQLKDHIQIIKAEAVQL